MPLRVLITNWSLSARSGTEMHARDLAIELQRRGHAPTVYSPMPGVISDELQEYGIRILSDLEEEREAPHVIHGHHLIETMTAVLRFSGVPAIFVCHDRTAWHDQPPRHPRLLAHVAVDDNCRERFTESHIDPTRVRVIPNAVDLARFRPRSPLPPRPRRAILFSHYAAEHTHLPPVRDACERAGLELDVIGNASGHPCARPEELLGNYDLVFAKARCALEAMAVGCAVVLCDHLGSGPLVRTSDWHALRKFNFGRRTCSKPLTVDNLLAEIAYYDAADAAEVCRLTRTQAGVEHTADALLTLYDEVIREQSTASPDPVAEARAAAGLLTRTLSQQFVCRIREEESEHWKASAEAAHRGWAELHKEHQKAIEACGDVQRGWAALHKEHQAVREACDAAHRGWAELQQEYERILAECQRLQVLVNAHRAA